MQHTYFDTNDIKIFANLCVRGQLKAAQSIYSEKIKKIEFQILYTIFNNVCFTDHVHVIHWLYQENKQFSQLNERQIQYLFFIVCEKGYKLMIQWFLITYPQTIHDIDRAFEKACFRNYIFVAKLLLQLKPSLSITHDNHSIWKHAVTNCHYDIINLLQQTKPETYVYIRRKYSTDLHYIRSEREIRLQRQLIPLWLTSSNSPNKNCLLYQLPRDISRYIIQQFI